MRWWGAEELKAHAHAALQEAGHPHEEAGQGGEGGACVAGRHGAGGGAVMVWHGQAPWRHHLPLHTIRGNMCCNRPWHLLGGTSFTRLLPLLLLLLLLLLRYLLLCSWPQRSHEACEEEGGIGAAARHGSGVRQVVEAGEAAAPVMASREHAKRGGAEWGWVTMVAKCKTDPFCPSQNMGQRANSSSAAAATTTARPLPSPLSPTTHACTQHTPTLRSSRAHPPAGPVAAARPSTAPQRPAHTPACRQARRLC